MILFIAPSGVVTSLSSTLPVSLLEVGPAINLSVMLFCFSTARGAKQPASVQQECQQEKTFLERVPGNEYVV